MERQQIASETVWEDEVCYARAVCVGERIELSGTTAADENGDIVGVGDPYAQAKQAIEHVERALEATGASLDDVIRTRIFVTDIDHYDAVDRAHSEAFGDVRPATSMCEIQRLVDPSLIVEIEASAVSN